MTYGYLLFTLVRVCLGPECNVHVFSGKLKQFSESDFSNGHVISRDYSRKLVLWRIFLI